MVRGIRTSVKDDNPQLFFKIRSWLTNAGPELPRTIALNYIKFAKADVKQRARRWTGRLDRNFRIDSSNKGFSKRVLNLATNPRDGFEYPRYLETGGAHVRNAPIVGWSGRAVQKTRAGMPRDVARFVKKLKTR